MGTATYVKICCPRCGEKDLNIIGDRDIGGAVASGMGVSVFAGTKAGVLAGASGLQQKIYWICKKCGRKFRNPDELTAEIFGSRLPHSLHPFHNFVQLLFSALNLVCRYPTSCLYTWGKKLQKDNRYICNVAVCGRCTIYCRIASGKGSR